MSQKSLITLCGSIGSIAGGYLPALWGANSLSAMSVLTGLVGGLAGIWAGWKLSHL